jgi:hypothetical protein
MHRRVTKFVQNFNRKTLRKILGVGIRIIIKGIKDKEGRV